MTAVIYAKWVRCDVCGVTGEAVMGESSWPVPQSPDGWLSLGAREIRKADGSTAVRDLCPACKVKPFDMIEAMGET